MQFKTDGVPGTGVLGDRVVPAIELLALRENRVTIGVVRPSSASDKFSSFTSRYTILKKIQKNVLSPYDTKAFRGCLLSDHTTNLFLFFTIDQGKLKNTNGKL